MREIKFRAWNKKARDMASWSLLQEMSKPYHWFWEGIKSDENIILMQFTGLHDKNGKEDYHKDVCKYRDDSNTWQVGIIEWQSGAWWLKAIGGDDEGNQDVMLAHADGHINIGNIYENPDLLTPTQEE